MVAHARVSFEGVHNGVEQFLREVWRSRELLLCIVGRLLDQGLALEELPLQDVVHIDEPVIIGEVALKEIVDP